MIEFTLCGVRVTVSVWFAAFFCLLFAGQRTPQAGWFLYLLAHELGHAAAAAVCGEKPRAVGFYVGRVRMVGGALRTRRAQLLISLSGPGVNLLLAGFFALRKNTDAYAVNLLLAGFNLLPVRSLDGGAALEALLPRRMAAARADAVCRGISLAVSLIVTTAGFWLMLRCRNPLLLMSGALLVCGCFFGN
ncbi:MAG: hypothetical protein VB021_07870 [Oscillospiraceae bacterium]|nr:hypothetical protein [Oscillospiraceae bacterium]